MFSNRTSQASLNHGVTGEEEIPLSQTNLISNQGALDDLTQLVSPNETHQVNCITQAIRRVAGSTAANLFQPFYATVNQLVVGTIGLNRLCGIPVIYAAVIATMFALSSCFVQFFYITLKASGKAHTEISVPETSNANSGFFFGARSHLLNLVLIFSAISEGLEFATGTSFLFEDESMIKYITVAAAFLMLSDKIYSAEAMNTWKQLQQKGWVHDKTIQNGLEPHQYYVNTLNQLPHCNKVKDYEQLLPWGNGINDT